MQQFFLKRLRQCSPVGAVFAAVLSAVGCRAGGDRANAARVVSVSKQINEFIYGIGSPGNLVARDLTSIYPPAITQLPSVGYHRALSAEGITSMKPTLFLTDGNVGPDAVLGQLPASAGRSGTVNP